jgi:riboflavin synthase
MFTGIITDTAKVRHSRLVKDGLILTLERPTGWGDLALGDSVSTNGVCLTVAEIRDDEYDCMMVPETLRVTAFGGEVPAVVNLERPLREADRMGGHFVQGHVDGVGIVTKVSKDAGHDVYLRFPPESRELVIPKGSIAINGVSLTVAAVADNTLRVALVPHTLEHTTLGLLGVGDRVNLEFDMIGKYIVRIMEMRNAKG